MTHRGGLADGIANRVIACRACDDANGNALSPWDDLFRSEP